ncbi:hypothetical protein O988_02914, partial [Pseudogymnoascus sp. VKM F-3808]
MDQRTAIITVAKIEETQRQPHLSSKPSHTFKNATGTTTTHPQSHPHPRDTARQRQASQETKSQELTQTAQYSRKATAYLAAPLIPSTGRTRNALTGEHTKKNPDPVLVNRRSDRPRHGALSTDYDGASNQVMIRCNGIDQEQIGTLPARLLRRYIDLEGRTTPTPTPTPTASS